MSTRQIAPGKRGKQKSESRFQRLWSEAEALAKDNAELEKGLDVLVRCINEEVFTAERHLGETIRLFVYRQLEFASKKSLLKWQREELNDWIDENLSELMAMGLLDEPLQNKLALLRASEMGIDLDPDNDLSPAEQLDEYFNAETDEFDSADSGAKNKTGDVFDDDDELEDDDGLAELLRKLHAEFENTQEQMETPSPRRNRNAVEIKSSNGFFSKQPPHCTPTRKVIRLVGLKNMR